MPASQRIEWVPSVQLFARVDRGAKARIVSITPMPDGSLAVIGVEAPADAMTLAEVLDSHAHADLGTHRSEAKAKAAAKAFLLAPKAHRMKSCECSPVARPRSKRKAVS